MLMTSLAWSLKVWLALSMPETGRWKIRRQEEKFRLLKMEFRTFVTAMIRVPCQICRHRSAPKEIELAIGEIRANQRRASFVSWKSLRQFSPQTTPAGSLVLRLVDRSGRSCAHLLLPFIWLNCDIAVVIVVLTKSVQLCLHFGNLACVRWAFVFVAEFVRVLLQVVEFPFVERIKPHQFVLMVSNAVLSWHHVNTWVFVVVIVDTVSPVVRMFAFQQQYECPGSTFQSEYSCGCPFR
jgi:hypothetical protein